MTALSPFETSAARHFREFKRNMVTTCRPDHTPTGKAAQPKPRESRTQPERRGRKAVAK